MSRAKPAPLNCDTCQRAIAVGDHVSYGSIESGYRQLCSRCFNEEIARVNGIDFQHVQLDPVEMQDAAGQRHEFHFRVHLLGDRMSLESFELCAGEPGGYQFQALAGAEDDLFGLIAELIKRMRRALSVRHLKEERRFGLSIANFLVRGRIDWDRAEDRRVPLLVIDGREVTWEQFGQMLISFEGWQFKLEIRDRSEEI
jgi:hypothetical protein